MTLETSQFFAIYSYFGEGEDRISSKMENEVTVNPVMKSAENTENLKIISMPGCFQYQ